MDIYNYLKKDHEAVSELMAKVLNASSPERRAVIFEEIKQELLLHAETEKKTFYTALEKQDITAERIQEANQEHQEIKDYIKKLSKMPAENIKWLELFGEFKHAVEHHVHEEEDIVFPKAKKLLSAEEAKELAKEMERLKNEVRKKSAA